MTSELLINALAVIGALTVIFLTFKLMLSFKLISYYSTARFSGAPISLVHLFLMKFRKVNVQAVVDCYIVLSKSQIQVDIMDLEIADLAGNNVINITKGLITAKKNGIPLTIQQAIEADRNQIDIVSEINKNS